MRRRGSLNFFPITRKIFISITGRNTSTSTLMLIPRDPTRQYPSRPGHEGRCVRDKILSKNQLSREYSRKGDVDLVTTRQGTPPSPRQPNSSQIRGTVQPILVPQQFLRQSPKHFRFSGTFWDGICSVFSINLF